MTQLGCSDDAELVGELESQDTSVEVVGAGLTTPADKRARMVAEHLQGRGINDPLVLAAMGTVPRERFVPIGLAGLAYQDGPLPIDENQTISQPYVVALMAQAVELRPGSHVLEIGTGSGYGAAVLSRIAGQVVTVERHESLADSARLLMGELGYTNVEVICGDGTLGWPTGAPYDAIVVTAGGPSVPLALVDQLADGGRLVVPVGPRQRGQELMLVTRRGASTSQRKLGSVRFVPLIGEQGW